LDPLRELTALPRPSCWISGVEIGTTRTREGEWKGQQGVGRMEWGGGREEKGRGNLAPTVISNSRHLY